MTLDAIAELWRQRELSLSAIGDRLGLSRGQVVGKIDRARRAGDERFKPRPSRPKVAPGRDGNLPGAGKTRKLKPIDEHVGNSRPLPPAPEPSGPRLLIDLDWRGCRWPMGEAPDSRHLFCGRPQASGRPYCERCSALAKGGGVPSSQFVLREVTMRITAFASRAISSRQICMTMNASERWSASVGALERRARERLG